MVNWTMRTVPAGSDFYISREMLTVWQSAGSPPRLLEGAQLQEEPDCHDR